MKNLSASFGLVLLLAGCQAGHSTLQTFESAPNRDAFDWIACGEITMEDVRNRLGNPARSSGESNDRVNKVKWLYQWKYPSYTLNRNHENQDYEWEWGASNAVVLRSQFDGSELYSEMGDVFWEEILWDIPREDGETMEEIQLWVIFKKDTGVVWHKAFFAP